jgi:hypothetical protein
MTKAREQMTPEHAITVIAALITWEGAAEAVGKTDRAVRHWSDPDVDRCPCLQDCIALDLAYLKAGGSEAPLLKVYMRRIEEAAQQPAPLSAALSAGSDAIRRAGEFGADIIAAAQPGASPKLIAKVRGEAEEAASAFVDVAQKLSSANSTVTPMKREVA